jgi:hypothetical protein
VRLVGPISLGWVLACATPNFLCESDEQCVAQGIQGFCTLEFGACIFPADDCPSKQRYGELSPGKLAGSCVDPDNESSSGEDDSPDSSVTDDPSSETANTSGVETSMETSGGSGSESGTNTTGDATEDPQTSTGSDCSFAGCACSSQLPCDEPLQCVLDTCVSANCDDSLEPNDLLSPAVLPIGVIACGGGAHVGVFSTSSDDSDAYVLTMDAGGECSNGPVVTATAAPPFELDICAFFSCGDKAGVAVSCSEGAGESLPNGMLGCCGTGAISLAAFPCAPETVEAAVLIQVTSPHEVCAPYDIDVQL